MQRQAVQELRLSQQDDIYAAGAAAGKAPELKNVSAQELEQWELYHTELGCYYA